jgi:glycosyltransferase involved in cell wall biosynthesis
MAALEAGWSLERIQDPSLEHCAGMIERFAHEDLLRELSSIYRSDLTLVISSFELQLLTQQLGVPAELLLLQRLSYVARREEDLPPHSQRQHFVSIGNFRHPPNADAVQWLAREIWPEIRKRMPEAQIHLFGAYPSREMMALTDENAGFFVKGQAPDQYETLMRYRVLLAPLRFGAGIKGKISDAWSVGTPVVTTPLGVEGMGGSCEIALSASTFADTACELYSRENHWKEAQIGGLLAIRRLYHSDSNARILIGTLQDFRATLEERRSRNLTGAMLRHNLHRSTKYFSRWIELKQQLNSVRTGTPVAP